MLGNNQSVTNEKPRDSGGAKFQGNIRTYNNNNSTTFKESKSRHDKGMALYKAGRVSIGSNGFFRISGFEVDTERMTCTCPDYKNRKEPCKHVFAACLFVKNRGKQTIEHLNGFSNGSNANRSKPESESKYAPNKAQEAHSKVFDRQATITRLATLNTATEILKTHRKPIELNEVLSLASQLEQWALGE